MQTEKFVVKAVACVALGLNIGVVSLIVPNHALSRQPRDPNKASCTTIKKGQTYWWETKNSLGQTVSGTPAFANSDMKLCRK